MKLGILAAATAAVLVAASPAMATNYFTPIVLDPITLTADIGQAHLAPLDPAGTAFTDTYSFATTLTGTAAAAAISITVVTSANYLNLLTASLNGNVVAFTSMITPAGRMYTASVSAPTNILPALNTLLISGVTVGTGGRYNGNVSIDASTVPEAATWGMMVLGFGAVGAGLRASRRKVVFA